MPSLKIILLGLLRYVIVGLAVGPLIAIMLVWTWMAVNGLSPDRAQIFDDGNLAIGLLLITAGVGIALELVLTPLLRADSARRG